MGSKSNFSFLQRVLLNSLLSQSCFSCLGDFFPPVNGGTGGALIPHDAPVPEDLLQPLGPFLGGFLQSKVGEAGVLQPALSLSSLRAAGPLAGLDTVSCTISTHLLVSKVNFAFSPSLLPAGMSQTEKSRCLVQTCFTSLGMTWCALTYW